MPVISYHAGTMDQIIGWLVFETMLGEDLRTAAHGCPEFRSRDAREVRDADHDITVFSGLNRSVST